MDQKECKECKKNRFIEDFYYIKARGRHMHYCKECHYKKIKHYRANSDKHKKYKTEYQQSEKYKTSVNEWRRSEHGRKLHRERMREHRIKLKEEVFRHYCDGELKCARCCFSDIRALSIDHVNGNGNEHRKELKHANKMYSWLKKNDYPSGFQVLCMNCQFIKRFENKETSPRIE